jgi:hypothetical protein
MKAAYTIAKDVHVGIYNDCCYVARIYTDKVIVTVPYVKWVGNTGGYAERRAAIRDQNTVDAILADMRAGYRDAAWAKMGRAIGDEYLTNSDF